MGKKRYYIKWYNVLTWGTIMVISYYWGKFLISFLF